jgi:group I intron endonuclease
MKKSGIYSIQCIVNGKYYIGQSKDIYSRISDHKRKLITNRHNNIKLQRAYNKYGIDCFVFSTLTICPLEEIDNQEKFYINLLDSVTNGYNIESGGNKNKIISDDTRQKMSIAKKGKPSNRKGVKYSDELKLKLSIAHTGLPSPKKGIKTGKPAWNSGKKGVQISSRRIPVIVSDKYTGEILGSFESKQHFCKKFNYKSKNYIKISETEVVLGKYILSKV